MKYDNYKIEDFLQDESFFNWVKRKNKEDIIFWEDWWRNNPTNHHNAQEAKNLIKNISLEDKAFSPEEISDLWKSIKQETIEYRQYNDPKKAMFSSNYFIKVAAVIVPLLIGTIYYMYTSGLFQDQNPYAPQLVVKEIPSGQKLTVYLPDGSMVKLNSESKISYSKPFDEAQRVVTLEGEAFFEVTPDPQRPFLVISAGIETKVVGTSFNVNAYTDEGQVEVSVVTGKVAIKKVSGENSKPNSKDLSDEAVMLSPSEKATYMVDKDEIIVSGYIPNEAFGWSNGILYFNNASMNEMVVELERWYGIDIILEREIPIKKGVVGEFHNQSLEEIMLGMHVASEFEYAFKNGKLIIK